MDYLQNFGGKEQNIPSNTICFVIPPKKKTKYTQSHKQFILSFILISINDSNNVHYTLYFGFFIKY